MKELTKRVLVALWGIPLILGLSYLGGAYFLLLILVINGMALWEFYSMYRKKDIHSYRILGVSLSLLLILSTYWLSPEYLAGILLIIVAGVLIRHLKLTEGNASINTIFTLGGILYIGLFLSAILKLRLNLSDWLGSGYPPQIGGRFLILLWISIWICDTFAYFGGSLFGRHKLAPRTSPNKTVEGAVSGLIGALLIFGVVGKFVLTQFPPAYLWYSGVIVGILGQLGDLVESRFKRDAGVKDTSTILPGHGGFLDRFDSFIFVSPFLFLLFYYLRP